METLQNTKEIWNELEKERRALEIMVLRAIKNKTCLSESSKILKKSELVDSLIDKLYLGKDKNAADKLRSE